MNGTSEGAASAAHASAAEIEVGLLDLLITLAGRKKVILGLSLLAVIVSAMASLVLPNRYAASALLMPAGQSQSITSAFVNQLSGLVNALAGDPDVSSKNDIYLNILRSRVVADRMVERFQLTRVYGTNSSAEARARLKADTRITEGAGGLIRIEVEAYEKTLVAPLANAYAVEVNNVAHELEKSAAARQKALLQRELISARTRLAKAEALLKGRVDDKGLSDVESEAIATMRISAQLLVQMSAVQAKLDSIQHFLAPHHPTVLQTKALLNALRSQAAQLGKQAVPAEQTVTSLLADRNIELLREVSYYKRLSDLLSKQYELARLDEQRPVAPLQTLDLAAEPEHKHGPARLLIVLTAGLTGLFFACAWAFISAARAQARREVGGGGIVSDAGAAKARHARLPPAGSDDRYRGGSMRRTFGQWMAAVLLLALILLLGIKRFEPWPQVLDLWESGVSPLLLAASGHPHFFRFMTSYGGFLLEEIYPTRGFSLYISLFFAANIFLWKRISLMSTGASPGILAWFCFIGIHLLMNGRGVIAWTAWLLCASICLHIAAGAASSTKRLLLTALACWLAAVSTGVFVVVVVALVIFHLQYRRRERAGLARKTFMLLIGVPVMYVVTDYFMVAVSKNIEFYGGGWQGMVGMLAHGVGKVLFGSELLAVLIVAFSAFSLLFLVALFEKRKQALTPLAKLIGCAAIGGLFGFTVLTLVLPLAFLYRTGPREGKSIGFKSGTLGSA